jgi:hypothetical protein
MVWRRRDRDPRDERLAAVQRKFRAAMRPLERRERLRRWRRRAGRLLAILLIVAALGLAFLALRAVDDSGWLELTSREPGVSHALVDNRRRRPHLTLAASVPSSRAGRPETANETFLWAGNPFTRISDVSDSGASAS